MYTIFMSNLAEKDVKDIIQALISKIKKITAKQIIALVVLAAVIITAYIFIGKYQEKTKIAKEAKRIATEIAANQKKFFAENKIYDKDYFDHHEQGFDFSLMEEELPVQQTRRNRRRFENQDRNDSDSSASQVGVFYVEVNAENACVTLKYKKDTTDKTIFFASFEDPKPLCTGVKCLKKDTNPDGKLCYKGGECYQPFLSEKTKQSCGNNHGTQTRNCTPNCDGGKCDEWSPCECKEGYGWDGKTCAQLQTEKDCTPEQCFNGLSCENKEPLEKEIEKGTCTREATCQGRGWKYTNWKCSCPDENFCSLKEECVAKPEKQKTFEMPNQQGTCSDTFYVCQEGEGWQTNAKKCKCKNIGTFWNKQAEKATCSSCTQKPNNSHYISAGTDKDDCAWECNKGFENRKGNCVRPNGKFLCANMNPEICTDDFSKERKLKKDTATNEGQACFTEDNENILFYTAKTKSCILCQCFDFSKEK